MHIADVSMGNLGANGIVAGGIPIAVGAALSAKRMKTGKVVVSFFGDGANNEGAFHEALNMASIWKLPVIFVCENNGYGMSTSTARSTAVKNIADRAAAYSMPGVIVERQHLLRGRRSLACGGRARARRRRPDADRVQDLSLSRPLEERPQPLPHQGRDRGLDLQPRSDRAVRGRAQGIRHRRRRRASKRSAKQCASRNRGRHRVRQSQPLTRRSSDLERFVYTEPDTDHGRDTHASSAIRRPSRKPWRSPWRPTSASS